MQIIGIAGDLSVLRKCYPTVCNGISLILGQPPRELGAFQFVSPFHVPCTPHSTLFLRSICLIAALHAFVLHLCRDGQPVPSEPLESGDKDCVTGDYREGHSADEQRGYVAPLRAVGGRGYLMVCHGGVKPCVGRAAPCSMCARAVAWQWILHQQRFPTRFKNNILFCITPESTCVVSEPLLFES